MGTHAMFVKAHTRHRDRSRESLPPRSIIFPAKELVMCSLMAAKVFFSASTQLAGSSGSSRNAATHRNKNACTDLKLAILAGVIARAPIGTTSVGYKKMVCLGHFVHVSFGSL